MAIVLSILLVYFSLWRPVRSVFSNNAVLPAINRIFDTQPETEWKAVSAKGAGLELTYRIGEKIRKMSYATQGGFFFLVAVIVLLFVTPTLKYYLWLAGFHAIMELCVWAGILWGTFLSPWGFVFADFIISYFSPAASMIFVVLVYQYRRKEPL